MGKGLPKGLVFKSETSDKGEAFYTIILKNRFNIPWINKTASLYKNGEDESSPLKLSKIRIYDFRDYLRYFNAGMQKFPDEEETARLKESIGNLPEKIIRKMYGKEKITLINRLNMPEDSSFDPTYPPTIKKISKINSESLKREMLPRRKDFSRQRNLPI